jgi:hypothetical protein
VSGATARRGAPQRVAGLALVTAVLGLVVGAGSGAGPARATQSAATLSTATGSRPAFTQTEKISRVNYVNNATQVVDSRTFTASVNNTTQLRNRQEIDVSWSGAHPTGGIVADENSELASEQEYPVVLMMCRGKTSATAGKDQITPETCWTQTSAERVQVDNAFNFPPYRLDLYASTADRGPDAGVPSPLPSACTQFATGVQHWIPFTPASGKTYEVGPQGCAGLPPEAANAGGSLQPGNTTYGVSDLQGNGSAKFVISTAETNQSLGCSDTVSCALVIIPIMGISCDPAGDSLPPVDRPPSDASAQAFAECSETGAYQPGQPAAGDIHNAEDLTVSGQLWWSASNWQNRLMVPLTFAPPSNVCALVTNSTPVPIYGSYLLLGATQQWAPHFCLNKKLFSLQHVLTGEPEAQNLLQAGSIDAAFEAAPPQTPFTGRVVQAPTAVTGFAIVFDIVDKFGQQYTTLRLDARLLAKLLTESYPSITYIQQNDTALQNPTTHQPNPLNIADDPEFKALNPTIPNVIGDLAGASAATLLAVSGNADAMWALTSYVNADPEARAWLDGKPDPWGMVVNPKYKGIKLPVTQWPLLDTYIPTGLAASNSCLAETPVPWLPLVASPVESMASITIDMQFDLSDSQVNCNNSFQFPSFTSVGPENPGQTFILGITSLADADQFGLDIASLETQGGSTSDTQFSSAAGRSFAAPSTASLRAAVRMMAPDPKTGSWTVPYAKMRTASGGKSAYPGTMLISTDVATHGVPKAIAADLGKFLSFVALSGQHSGFGNGQLPPGYLPMTAANGAAKMLAYTKTAAADVGTQDSKVPSVTGGGQSGGRPTHSTSPTPATSTTQPTSGSGTGGSHTSSPSATIQPVTASPGPTNTQRIATTANVASAVSGAILPLVLLIALIGATLAYGAWQLTRPADPK